MSGGMRTISSSFASGLSRETEGDHGAGVLDRDDGFEPVGIAVHRRPEGQHGPAGCFGLEGEQDFPGGARFEVEGLFQRHPSSRGPGS